MTPTAAFHITIVLRPKGSNASILGEVVRDASRDLARNMFDGAVALSPYRPAPRPCALFTDQLWVSTAAKRSGAAQ